MILAVLSLLVLLAVLGLIVYGATRLRQHDPARPAVSPGHAIRRFFQYILLIGLLFAAATGVTGLLGRILDTDPELRVDDQALALQLTLTFIALPLWAGLAVWTHRRLRTDPAERLSAGWAVYVTVASLVALLMAIPGWHMAVSMIAGRQDFRGEGAMQAVVWTVVWLGHHLWSSLVTPATHLRPVNLLGSLTGLITSVIGLVMMLTPALREITGLAGTSIAGARPLADVAIGAGVLTIGALVWATYWLRGTLHSQRDTGWLMLVLLAGVAGGLLLAVVSISLLAYDVLVWLVGDPTAPTIGEHLASLPGQLATAVVGLVVWWYHREVLGARRTQERTEVRRVYEYLLAAVGLLAASAGLVMVLVTIVEAVAMGSDLVVGGSALNALLGALVLLAVGLPVWWRHWHQAQGARARDPRAELASLSRRAYLLVLFGVMGIAAVIALITLVYLVLEDILEGRAGLDTLRSVRFALGILVTTSLLSGYHWAIFRSDREEAARHEVVPDVSHQVSHHAAAQAGSPSAGSSATAVRFTVHDLDPAVREGLAARADERGLPLESYVRQVLIDASGADSQATSSPRH